MYVSPIENSNSFKQRLIIKRSAKANPEFVEKLTRLESFQKLIARNDVIMRVHKKPSYNGFNKWDDPLYMIKLSVLKENSWFERLKDSFGFIKRQKLTKNYHTKREMINSIDGKHVSNIVF